LAAKIRNSIALTCARGYERIYDSVFIGSPEASKQIRRNNSIHISLGLMNARPVSDERLRAVRGRFRDSPTWRFISRSCAILLVFLSAITPAALIWSRGSPVWPLTSTEWIVLIAAAGTCAAAFVVWTAGDREYEFTGEEILERRRGVIQWRVPISVVTRVQLERVRGGGIWAHFYSGSQRYSVFLVPELRKQLLFNET
jgi:hypothetical protein